MRLREIESPLSDNIETFPFMRKTFTYMSSPLNFQNKSGISVCQYYKMPENLPVETVYKYYSSILGAFDRNKIKKSEVDQRIGNIIGPIRRLNPDLASIHNESIQDSDVHVLTAALSLFNIGDIRSYVEEGKTLRWYMSQPGWDTRYKMQHEIETLTGAQIYWVMSDKTLKRVYAEVSMKYKNK